MKRALHFSVDGPFINNLALEQCHREKRIGYAFDLIRDVTLRENQTEAESLKLALDILNGKFKLKGTYPNDDYRIEPADENDPKYSVRETIDETVAELTKAKADLDVMNQKLACIADCVPNTMLRSINRTWRDDYGNDDDIFPQDDPFDTFMTGSPMTDRSSQTKTIAVDQMLDDYIEHQMSGVQDDDYGWLSPDGTFYPSTWGSHSAWANEYCHKHKPYGWNYEKHAVNAYGDNFLSDHGWILLHSPHMGTARITESATSGHRLTKAQREFLYDYYMKRNKTDLASEYFSQDA